MKWLRRAGWLVLSWAVGCAALWLVLPLWLKPQIESQVSSALGREVRVEKLDIRPWALAVGLRGVVVAGGASSDSPLLTVQEVEVDADLRSLWERAPVVSAVLVRAPKLRLTRLADGRYDVDDLITKLTQPSATPSSEPARFALYNLQLEDGEIDFDDRPVQRVQQVRSLNLSLPFLSNLPTQVHVKVEPRVQFVLNGSAFDSGAQATPFAQQRSAVVQLTLATTDLSPYVGYIPQHLPLRLTSGTLAAQLALHLDMPVGLTPRIQLVGDLQTKNMALTDAAAAPLLGWRQADWTLLDVQPLGYRVHLGALVWEGLQLNLSRSSKGPWNFLSLVSQAGRQQAPETKQVETSATKPLAASAPGATHKTENPWHIRVKSVVLKNSVVALIDAAVKPTARLQLQSPELRWGAWAWPVQPGPAPPSPTEFAVVASLHTVDETGVASGAQGSLNLQGHLRGSQLDAEVALDDLGLQPFAPYVNQFLQPRLAARVSAKTKVVWSAPLNAGDGAWTLSEAGVTVSDLRLTTPVANRVRGVPAPAPVFAFKTWQVSDLSADSRTQLVKLGNVVWTQPKATVQRDKSGLWNLQKWLVQADPPPAPTQPQGGANAKAPNTNTNLKPWQIQVAQFQLKGGELDWSDAAADKRGVELQARALQLHLRDVAWDGRRLSQAVSVQLEGRLNEGVRANDPSTRSQANWALFNAQATVNLEPFEKTPGRSQVSSSPRATKGPFHAPGGLAQSDGFGGALQIKGKLKTERFPVHVFAPYAAQVLPVDLRRADLACNGDFNLAQTTHGKEPGWSVQASGELAVANLEVLDWPDATNQDEEALGEPLISWQRLLLEGVRVRLAPGTRPDVEVAQADITGLVSRLVITEQGSFNLRDVAAPAKNAATDAAKAPIVSPEQAAPSQATSPDAKAADLPLRFVLGGVKVSNATVDFTDRFIRPNFSAKLTELNGSLGAVRSDSRDMAPLTLKGRAAGTALLDIAGQVNPMVQPLALDINAKASDLELAPLTAYAAKYAGYAIERGKLSVELQYKIDPHGRLEANNQLILNQLTFGEKVDSPSATKLPVLLAVALLKDRHGVIDINLPVSGSLQDPQFSVGGIIWKVILNLIGKALTAPFSLLTGGGSADLSVVEFVPGTARVSEKGQAALNKVGQALIDRPSLRMTVSGAADPLSERDAFAQAAVQAQVLAEQKRELARSGSTPEVLPELTAQEHALLLRRIYRQTDMPGKPRNALGLTKDIPAAEMEAMLKNHVRVSEQAMRELALQRGLTVRQSLADQGVPSERLFLAAPKLRVSGEGDAAWVPSVQLTLATR